MLCDINNQTVLNLIKIRTNLREILLGISNPINSQQAFRDNLLNSHWTMEADRR